MPRPLFSDLSWFDFSQQREAAAVRRIDALLERETFGDVGLESIINSITSEFSLEPLEIGEGRFTELKDIDLGTSQLANPSQWNLPSSIRPPGSVGKAVTFRVPYTGTSDLLLVRPSFCSGNPPVADISASEILFTYKESLMYFPDTTALVEKFKSYSIRDHLLLKQWTARINEHAEGFNRSIREVVNRRIQALIHKKTSDQMILDDLNS